MGVIDLDESLCPNGLGEIDHQARTHSCPSSMFTGQHSLETVRSHGRRNEAECMNLTMRTT